MIDHGYHRVCVRGKDKTPAVCEVHAWVVARDYPFGHHDHECDPTVLTAGPTPSVGGADGAPARRLSTTILQQHPEELRSRVGIWPRSRLAAMTRRKFNSDLLAATQQSVAHVSRVEKGDDDGTLVVTFEHGALARPLTIRLGTVSVDDYPDLGFFAYSDDDDIPAGISDLLVTLSDMTTNKCVIDVLRMISKRVDTALDTTQDEDVEMTDVEDDTDVEETGTDEYSSDDGFYGGTQQSRAIGQQSRLPHSGREINGRFIQDLQQAKSAGFKIAFLSDVTRHASECTFALSVPVSHLGLPDDTLEAWEIKSKEHMVLLCKYDSGYPSMDKFTSVSQNHPSTMTFAFGTCSTYKPSLSSALAAFNKNTRNSKTAEYGISNRNVLDQEAVFVQAQITSSVDNFVNSELALLLQNRLNNGVSWDNAKQMLQDRARAGHLRQSGSALAGMDHSHGGEELEPAVSIAGRSQLNIDYVLRSPDATLHLSKDQLSLPLIAAQFALRYFVKSTQYCLGSPEQENRFKKELDQLPPTAYPTIFAWHGSKLFNWHSIIRSGLNYDEVQNGRAYGNGVYFAKQFQVSQGYSTYPEGLGWVHSELNICSAISLCEIINRTQDFVSKHPYYVVNNVDWIQCRYLLVQRRPQSAHSTHSSVSSAYKPTTLTKSLSSNSSSSNCIYVVQDSKQVPEGPNGKILRVPMAALPKWRQIKEKPGSPALQSTQASSSQMLDDNKLDDFGEIIRLQKTLAATEVSNEEESADTVIVKDDPTKLSFTPGTVNVDSLPKLPAPVWATDNGRKVLGKELKALQKLQAKTPPQQLGWYINFENVDNMFHWIVELHSFELSLPLAQDMKRNKVSSIILEVRFGQQFPVSPPFVRVIRPRFLPFSQRGGGHVTAGGAMCMELLTNSGWSPVSSLESVLLQVRMAMCSLDPYPARLEAASRGRSADYGIGEAIEAYRRSATTHGWDIPSDLNMMNFG
ncbi:Ubiquitin-conjugating enzyme E2Q-like protein [Colletotrichum orbiculare MAFF 240422]|uniref:Ubiquitin-conjugating enzyme E2Q-like protein n=1 Tax=Colletotrichum orbiculare (strain 104-T / ATCC 96160 / CBS 514.97 / LARS 414 / MAFF 240422) TaxID=1213857 RepID=A0A484FXC7_COLOR|nr:Ubiquitin-conjugating enzyme E2Q-like protein [Colletotrichum orbiculare MAFF 240422]